MSFAVPSSVSIAATRYTWRIAGVPLPAVPALPVTCDGETWLWKSETGSSSRFA
jgi:hypothetical protein